ncbi:SDR family oxidoreductase [Nitrosopumilus ureiphilus]|nr:SDR family oxidoreductase [Nitrosopumilus ureiphilus]
MVQIELKNKNCVITGATGGIGKEIAQILARKGCNLFLISTDNKKLFQLESKIKNLNNIKIFTFATDLSNYENLENVVSKIKESFDSVDIVINSAGIFYVDSLIDSSIEKFEKAFNINVRAPFYLSKIFSEDMIAQNWGRIVNIGSSSSYSGFKNGSIYCTTKHAVLGLSRSLHEELKSKNVRCYCISPASTKTEMGKISIEQNFETFLDPIEVAETVVFVLLFDENLVINEIRLNRMKIE